MAHRPLLLGLRFEKPYGPARALVHQRRVRLHRLPDRMRSLVAVDRRLQQMPTGGQRETTRMQKGHE
ncbi:hypothetical protein ADK52_12575, partial [Streptomyces sp. WM6372]|uniref:hypothetical protein n=1 Tax=Streptomyces sp. WM6372 TaxID=1415555 RepID=UPI0006C72D1D